MAYYDGYPGYTPYPPSTDQIMLDREAELRGTYPAPIPLKTDRETDPLEDFKLVLDVCERHLGVARETYEVMKSSEEAIDPKVINSCMDQLDPRKTCSSCKKKIVDCVYWKSRGSTTVNWCCKSCLRTCPKCRNEISFGTSLKLYHVCSVCHRETKAQGFLC